MRLSFFELILLAVLAALWGYTFLSRKSCSWVVAPLCMLIMATAFGLGFLSGPLSGMFGLLFGYALTRLWFRAFHTAPAASQRHRIFFKLSWMLIALGVAAWMGESSRFLFLVQHSGGLWSLASGATGIGLLLFFLRPMNRSLSQHIDVLSGLKHFPLYAITGFSEEILFRGLLLFSFLDALSLPMAVLSSSLLFAASHYRAGEPSGVKGSVYTFVLGLVASGTVFMSGSIYPAMLLHGCILPYVYLCWRLYRRSSNSSSKKAIRLYRYKMNGKRVLASTDRDVIIQIDPVACAVLDHYEKTDEEIIERLSPLYSLKAVQMALRELHRIERMGGRIISHKEYLMPTEEIRKL